MQGFSSANLWRMRNFYIAYQKNEKLAPMVREISWTNVVCGVRPDCRQADTKIDISQDDKTHPLIPPMYRGRLS